MSLGRNSRRSSFANGFGSQLTGHKSYSIRFIATVQLMELRLLPLRCDCCSCCRRCGCGCNVAYCHVSWLPPAAAQLLLFHVRCQYCCCKCRDYCCLHYCFHITTNQVPLVCKFREGAAGPSLPFPTQVRTAPLYERRPRLYPMMGFDMLPSSMAPVILHSCDSAKSVPIWGQGQLCGDCSQAECLRSALGVLCLTFRTTTDEICRESSCRRFG